MKTTKQTIQELLEEVEITRKNNHKIECQYPIGTGEVCIGCFAESVQNDTLDTITTIIERKMEEL